MSKVNRKNAIVHDYWIDKKLKKVFVIIQYDSKKQKYSDLYLASSKYHD